MKHGINFCCTTLPDCTRYSMITLNSDLKREKRIYFCEICMISNLLKQRSAKEKNITARNTGIYNLDNQSSQVKQSSASRTKKQGSQFQHWKMKEMQFDHAKRNMTMHIKTDLNICGQKLFNSSKEWVSEYIGMI